MNSKRLAAAFLIAVLAASILAGCASDSSSFAQAQALADAGDYSQALEILGTIPNYEQAPELARLCQQNIDYQKAAQLFEAGDYAAARGVYESLADFQDSALKVTQCQYAQAAELMEREQWSEAQAAFAALGSFSDAAIQAEACSEGAERARVEASFTQIDGCISSGSYDEALRLLVAMPDEPDTRERLSDAWYRLAAAHIEIDQFDQAESIFDKMPNQLLAREMDRQLPADQMQPIEYHSLLSLIKDGYIFGADSYNSSDAYGADWALSIGDYKSAPLLYELLAAWESGDSQKFSETFLSNQDELSPILTIDELITSTKLSYDGFTAINALLAVAPLYNELNSQDANNMQSTLVALHADGNVNTDNALFILNASGDQQKTLVCVASFGRVKDDDVRAAYQMAFRATAALPDAVRPSSLDEVGYILLTNYDEEIYCFYDNDYTLGMRKYAETILYSVPDKRVVKNFGTVKGTAPPKEYSYSGDAPSFVYGGEPDPDEINKNYLEAVEYLEKRAE